MVLRIFRDQTDLSDTVDNYNLFLPQIIYTVSPKGKLEQEIREPCGNSFFEITINIAG